MQKAIVRSTVFLISAGLLSACGGGGGGGGTATPFTSIADLPDNGTVIAEGQAQTARLRVNTITGLADITNVTTDPDSTLRLTQRNGNASAIAISAEGASVSIDTRRGGEITNLGPVTTFESDATNQIAILVVEGQTTFEHQSLGAWIASPDAGVASIGAGAYGAPTDVANIPRNQNATYNGASVGYAKDVAGQFFVTSSNVEVRTDFTTATISSTETAGENLQSGAVIALPGLDFNGGGPVAGAGFTAVVSGTDTLGQADGRFHGPNAEEVGGTYNLSGGNGTVHIGSFGAN